MAVKRSAVVISGIVGILAAAMVITFFLLPRTKPLYVTGDPLPISLEWVRPCEGDAVFDASGRPKGTDLEAYRRVRSWADDRSPMQFLFVLPAGGSEILFDNVMRARTPGYSVIMACRPMATDAGESLVASMDFFRARSRRLFGVRYMSLPERYVDISLQYLYGSQRPSKYTFTGPFSPSMNYTDDQTAGLVLTVRRDALRDEGQSVLVLEGPVNLMDETLSAFDKSGRRYRVDKLGGQGGTRGSRIECNVPGLWPDEIALLAVGETPSVRTFHNVNIRQKGVTDRGRPELLVDLSRLLADQSLMDKDVGPYRFRSTEDVLKAIDIVRGDLAVRAAEALLKPKYDFASLDTETAARVRRAALEWTRNWAPDVAGAGLRLGLAAGWPEFAQRAVALMLSGDPQIRYHAEQALYDNPRTITDELLPALCDAVRRTRDPSALSYLLLSVDRARTPAGDAAVLDLAGDQRPWIWYTAIRRLGHRLSRLRSSWNDTIRNRVAVADPSRLGEADPAVPAEAAKMLPNLATPETVGMLGENLCGFLDAIAQRCDRPAATEVLVTVLEASGGHSLRWDAMARIVRLINRLNGTNLGGLGADTSTAVYRECCDWRQIMLDVAAWHETGIDPGAMPEGYRPHPRDLRVIWLDASDREKSVVCLWRVPEAPASWPRLYAVVQGDRYFAFRFAYTEGATAGPTSLDTSWGQFDQSGRCTSGPVDVTRLPAELKPDAKTAARDVGPDMKVFVEAACSTDSVLSGTKVFADWRERYAPAQPIPAEAR